MRIAILSETFAKNMGYMGNMLPRHLARLGAEVHMVTLDLPPYYQIKDFKETYQDFTGSTVMKAGATEEYDGYRLHVLAHKPLAGYMYMSGLSEKLKEIRPDVVYSMAAIGWIALQAALLKPAHGYKLFTGSHTTASVFPLATQKNSPLHPALIRNAITRGVPGRMVSLLSEKCYGATGDCADVAVRFFGVQKSKIDVCPLGVDTDMFRPLQGSAGLERRREVRARFGVRDEEILCIYTGRFSQEKNPLVLAKAVAKLQAMGEPYRALFFGNGVQLEEIRAQSGCIPHPFVPVEELGDYFRASDIGVWPTQESTSMLDAAACGLPIVVNDTLLATERVEGNGVMYRLDDVDDMVRVLLSLKHEEVRKRLGAVGAEKMRGSFSWESIARRRLDDMKNSVLGKGV